MGEKPGFHKSAEDLERQQSLYQDYRTGLDKAFEKIVGLYSLDREKLRQTGVEVALVMGEDYEPGDFALLIPDGINDFIKKIYPKSTIQRIILSDKDIISFTLEHPSQPARNGNRTIDKVSVPLDKILKIEGFTELPKAAAMYGATPIYTEIPQ